MNCTMRCTRPGISAELSTHITHAASAALLRIGRAYQDCGCLQQAVSPYLKIVAYYPQTAAAPVAVEGLVSIARALEEQCRLHQAMGVYDRLERAARFQRWDGHSIDCEGHIQ